MGSGSSRAGKAGSSPSRRGRRGPGTSSAPDAQRRPEPEPEPEEAAARGCCRPEDQSLPPAAPAEPDPDLELLEQVLEECGEEGERPQGGKLSPAPGPSPLLRPLRLDAGDSGSLPPQGAPGSPQGQKVCFARSTPESSNFANQVPLKNPDRQVKIAYDYSEEELMATIEQEYCR